MFSKLDISHAYQQLLLDDDLKEYGTVITHKGVQIQPLGFRSGIQSNHFPEDNGQSVAWDSSCSSVPE